MAPAADIEMPPDSMDSEIHTDEKAAATLIVKDEPSDPTEVFIADFRRAVTVLEKAVLAKELRLISRVLRGTGAFRSRLNSDILARLVRSHVLESYSVRDTILAMLDTVPGATRRSAGSHVVPIVTDRVEKDQKHLQVPLVNCSPSNLPEIPSYVHLLVVVFMIDSKMYHEAVSLSKALVDNIASYNRRTLDDISARAFFYYSRSVELTNNLASIRTHLLGAYRTSVLRHDVACQAMLLNLLLRNYIEYNLFDQADKLISRAPFPATRSNNQLARNFYYIGRIKAIQLDYTDALWSLQQALRRAPQKSAIGFRLIVQKYMIVVQLLTGDIPKRSVFAQSNMKVALLPYLNITKAVRIGDLGLFKDVFESSVDTFTKDRTSSLILRLRHNVIKTGLRKLNLSYSQISLKDISRRLDLDSAEDAEGVVAKAIHDGVIEAVIDHEGGCVLSKDNMDVYTTSEPAESYHSRINFCMDIYNEAVRAMRFPETKEDEEAQEQLRERRRGQDELAKSLADEDEEDDGMMFE